MADKCEEKKHKNMFEKIYSGCEELKKAMQKPFVVSKIKREFESARDAALMDIDGANEELQSMRDNLSRYPLGAILEQRQLIRDKYAVIIEIEAEYADLFGSKMPVRIYTEEE